MTRLAWIGRAFRVAGVVMIALTSVRANCQATPAHIPAVHATSFSNEAVNLPGDLGGKVGVLVVGFSKSSGDVCKVWGQHLEATYENAHDVTYYQMPELESVPKLVRGMVLRSMKSSVPQSEQAHFMPIFSDEMAWKSVARFGNPDDAYVMVVDGDGKVLWQTSGKFTDAGFNALKEQVETLRIQTLKKLSD